MVVLVALFCIPYLAVPVYGLFWVVAQIRTRSSILPGVAVLGAWFATASFIVWYFLSGYWYSENTTLIENIESVIEIALLFVIFPAASLVYLHRVRG